MTIGTISTFVPSPIVLGTGLFGDTLTITGGILASPSGSTALTAPAAVSRPLLINAGDVAGGNGNYVQEGPAGDGGSGILFVNSGRILNSSFIGGGDGGDTHSEAVGGNGGTGILLHAESKIENSGIIRGGRGGYSERYTSQGLGGNGGDGIYAAAGGLLSNSGSIIGGASGFGGSAYGNGGAGVFFGQYGTVVNAPGGLIAGSAANYPYQYYVNSGDAVDFAKGGKLLNAGTIRGSSDGSAAVGFGGLGSLHNVSTISGGFGGVGVQLLAGGTVSNSGIISGGGGSFERPFYSPAIYAGSGVDISGVGILDNSGTISGGSGAYDKEDSYLQNGAAAVIFTVSSGTLHNGSDGLIVGGSGGSANRYSRPGNGGDGIDLTRGKLINNGIIEGGAGGYKPSDGLAANVPNGGIGVAITSGALINVGTITGGAGGGYDNVSGSGGAGAIFYFGSGSSAGDVTGGLSPGSGGTGGAGVIIEGGTFALHGGVIAGGAGLHGANGGSGVQLDGGMFEALQGTISGGSASYGGSAGAAVQFSTDAAATLMVNSGVKFEGAITGSSSARDAIVLMKGGDGRLTDFGAAAGINGITSIAEQSSAHWLLSGTITSSTSISLAVNSQLILSGVDAGNVYFAAGGLNQLILETPAGFADILHRWGAGDAVLVAGVHASAFTFSDGTLSLLNDSGDTLDRLYFYTKDTAMNFYLSDDKSGTSVKYQADSEPKSWDYLWHGMLPT